MRPIIAEQYSETQLCTVLNFVFREYILQPIIAEQYGEHGALYCAEQYGETQHYILKPIIAEQYGEHGALYRAELCFQRVHPEAYNC